MATQIYVNLPVKDLDAAKEFFTRLGFSVNAEFTDENASCVVLDEAINVMLLTEPFFKNFTGKEIADASRVTEVITALGVESRERVDEVCDKALAAGATPSKEPMDEGWMYSRSFQDLDGHLWELVSVDVEAMRAAQS
ncbi:MULTISPECIES: VOC family protein [unclassified Streptomyces]|uniref:VOC family protein n=1 Tax=unclassified Streptomyces TaxID=2593676 RepID=UPI0022B69C29|nr:MULTISPECIES: VOC family protein [unclassified Streptomyces]MCZ7413218.1 VOC family protein [Streptomyces sp. WMMC897]MCZ7430211.1 VOC family protein [Streptomyces sp. WMMC1477]